jgi:hypothetical protein
MLGKSFAFDKITDEKTSFALAEIIVHRGQSRMRQCREMASIREESLLGKRGEWRRRTRRDTQLLERDDTIKSSVPGQNHAPERLGGKLAFNAIAAIEEHPLSSALEVHVCSSLPACPHRQSCVMHLACRWLD